MVVAARTSIQANMLWVLLQMVQQFIKTPLCDSPKAETLCAVPANIMESKPNHRLYAHDGTYDSSCWPTLLYPQRGSYMLFQSIKKMVQIQNIVI